MVRWLATRRWSVTVAGAVAVAFAVALVPVAPVASVAIAAAVVALLAGVEVARWTFLRRMRNVPIVPEGGRGSSTAAPGTPAPRRAVEPKTARRPGTPAARNRR